MLKFLKELYTWQKQPLLKRYSIDPAAPWITLIIKNLKFQLLHAEKSANIFEKNLQKSVFSLLVFERSQSWFKKKYIEC